MNSPIRPGRLCQMHSLTKPELTSVIDQAMNLVFPAIACRAKLVELFRRPPRAMTPYVVRGWYA